MLREYNSRCIALGNCHVSIPSPCKAHLSIPRISATCTRPPTLQSAQCTCWPLGHETSDESPKTARFFCRSTAQSGGDFASSGVDSTPITPRTRSMTYPFYRTHAFLFWAPFTLPLRDASLVHAPARKLRPRKPAHSPIRHGLTQHPCRASVDYCASMHVCGLPFCNSEEVRGIGGSCLGKKRCCEQVWGVDSMLFFLLACPLLLPA